MPWLILTLNLCLAVCMSGRVVDEHPNRATLMRRKNVTEASGSRSQSGKITW